MRDSNPRPLRCEVFRGSSWTPHVCTGVGASTPVTLMTSVNTHDTAISEDHSEDRRPGSVIVGIVARLWAAAVGADEHLSGRVRQRVVDRLDLDLAVLDQVGVGAVG